MRNIARQVATGKKIAQECERYDIGCKELQALCEEYKKKPDIYGLCDAITNAYYFGLSVGSRCKLQTQAKDTTDSTVRESIIKGMECAEDEDVLKLIEGILWRLV